MDIKYESIVEANKGIAYTDVRGKNYAEVAQRVQAFRKLIPGGFILTDIISNKDGVVFMKSEAGYYAEDGRRVILSTGHAFERQDASNINNTSFIENCETSAIGRCLGFIGLGSEKSIASAEEVDNAIKTQEAIASGKIPDPTMPVTPPVADVSKVHSVPPVAQNNAPANQTPPAPEKPVNPVLDYLANERASLRTARKIGVGENKALWNKQTEVLKAAGLVPNKPLSDYTMQEAENLVNYMYSRFTQTGTELISDDGQTS